MGKGLRGKTPPAEGAARPEEAPRVSHHHAIPLPGLFLRPREAQGISQQGGGSLKTRGASEASAHRTPRPQEGSTSTSTSLRRKQRRQQPGPKPSPADPRGVLPSSRPCSGQQSVSPDRVGHPALHHGVTASKCTGPAQPPAGPKLGRETVTGRQRVTPG